LRRSVAVETQRETQQLAGSKSLASQDRIALRRELGIASEKQAMRTQLDPKTELASTSQPRRFRRISRAGLEHRGDVNLAPGAFHQANDFVLWQLEPGRFVVGRHRHRVVDPDCSGRGLEGCL